MITFPEAYSQVLANFGDYGTEHVPLKEAIGRVLAEDIYADRDFPPFDRATKDGIVINSTALEKGRMNFEVDGVIAAGQPAAILKRQEVCMEIMTGGVVPFDADTVVMYEHTRIDHGIAHLERMPVKGQNIHYRGSDRKKGELVLQSHRRLNPADIGILAAVGKTELKVRKLPRIAVISTGNELVDIDQSPQPHQVRKSNAYQLYAALREDEIHPLLLHVEDDRDIIRQKLSFAVQEMDVLLLSGGVSKGKYDFIPQVLSELGVERLFHGVSQRPGKPFWFGKEKDHNTLIFSFPGNPVSTFVCFYRYFKDWLMKSLGLPIPEITVILNRPISVSGDLTLFMGVETHWENGELKAEIQTTTGSGDLTSLGRTDGLICLQPREEAYPPGSKVPFIPVRKLP